MTGAAVKETREKKGEKTDGKGEGMILEIDVDVKEVSRGRNVVAK